MKQISLLLFVIVWLLEVSLATNSTTHLSTSSVTTSNKKLSTLKSRLAYNFEQKVARYSERKTINALHELVMEDRDSKWWFIISLTLFAASLLFGVLGLFVFFSLYVAGLFFLLGLVAAIICLNKLFLGM